MFIRGTCRVKAVRIRSATGAERRLSDDGDSRSENTTLKTAAVNTVARQSMGLDFRRFKLVSLLFVAAFFCGYHFLVFKVLNTEY